MRASLAALIVVFAAGCKQGKGDYCNLDRDCESGLVCALRTPDSPVEGGVCQSPSQATPDGAPADAATSDAAVPDAVAPDAAPPDAAPPDAAPPDAGPKDVTCVCDA